MCDHGHVKLLVGLLEHFPDGALATPTGAYDYDAHTLLGRFMELQHLCDLLLLKLKLALLNTFFDCLCELFIKDIFNA